MVFMTPLRTALLALLVVLTFIFAGLLYLYVKKARPPCGLDLKKDSESQSSYYPCGFLMADDSNVTAILLGQIKRVYREGERVFLDLNVGSSEEKVYLGELSTSNMALESHPGENVLFGSSREKKVLQKLDVALFARLQRYSNRFVLVYVPTLANRQYLDTLRTKLQESNQAEAVSYLNECRDEVAMKIESLKMKAENPAKAKSPECLLRSAHVKVLN